jgi:Tfp pilus assembly protein PilV
MQMYENKLSKNNKYFEGFTLLGTLFSAFLVIIILAAIASLSAQVYGSSRTSKNRFIAVGLAKEGIELVRNIRDGNWLYYVPVADGTPITTMKWRGNGEACVANASCLRDLCNNTFHVDALTPVASNFGLSAVASSDTTKLKIDGNDFYNYTSGTDSIFSRLITIAGSGACGETAESDSVKGIMKPQPMIVTSTVQWKDSPSGVIHTTVLQESLYDWKIQRP